MNNDLPSTCGGLGTSSSGLGLGGVLCLSGTSELVFLLGGPVVVVGSLSGITHDIGGHSWCGEIYFRKGLIEVNRISE